MERLWLMAESMNLAMQPVSPLYLFATNEEEMIELAGERRLHELTEHSEQFREIWNIGDTEALGMVFRVFKADSPSVHSIRLPLDHSLSRKFDTSDVENGLRAYGN